MSFSITLGGVSLPDLIDESQLLWSGVAAGTERTIQGKLIVSSQAINGRPIDLTGGDDWGWITKNTLNALISLANTPYAIYDLIRDFGTDPVEITRVRFRHEDGAVIEATPLIPRPNIADEDYYNNVKIRLMEV